MTKHLIILAAFIFSNSYAVENYKDIYIDREQDIVIHGILCGTDIKKLRKYQGVSQLDYHVKTCYVA